MAVRQLDQEVLDEITTRADELYRNMEDQDAYDDIQGFFDDVQTFLDKLITVCEKAGGRVAGMSYTDGRGKYNG